MEKQNNGFTRFIMAGIFGALIFMSFGWTTVVFFNISTKLDNHLFHMDGKLDTIINKFSEVKGTIGDLRGRVGILEDRNVQNR